MLAFQKESRLVFSFRIPWKTVVKTEGPRGRKSLGRWQEVYRLWTSLGKTSFLLVVQNATFAPWRLELLRLFPSTTESSGPDSLTASFIMSWLLMRHRESQCESRQINTYLTNRCFVVTFLPSVRYNGEEFLKVAFSPTEVWEFSLCFVFCAFTANENDILFVIFHRIFLKPQNLNLYQLQSQERWLFTNIVYEFSLTFAYYLFQCL